MRKYLLLAILSLAACDNPTSPLTGLTRAGEVVDVPLVLPRECYDAKGCN
jgi:hypothetical protein